MVRLLDPPRPVVAPVSRKQGVLAAIWLAGLVLNPVTAALKPDGGIALAAEEQPTPASAIDIAVEQGLLTVDARGAPLADLLRAMGKRNGFRVVIRGDLSTPVTTSFTRLPVEKAIRRLLRNYSYGMVMIYAPSSGETDEVPLAEVVIYTAAGTAVAATEGDPATTSGEDHNARMQTLESLLRPREEAAVPSLAQIILQDDDPVIRAHAAIGLGNVGGDQAVPALAAAVVDSDRSVRRNAIRGLAMIGGDEAVQALAEAVIHDPEPQNRRLAANALGRLGNEEMRWALEAAKWDPNDMVSEAAASALNQWERYNWAPD